MDVEGTRNLGAGDIRDLAKFEALVRLVIAKHGIKEVSFRLSYVDDPVSRLDRLALSLAGQ